MSINSTGNPQNPRVPNNGTLYNNQVNKLKPIPPDEIDKVISRSPRTGEKRQLENLDEDYDTLLDEGSGETGLVSDKNIAFKHGKVKVRRSCKDVGTAIGIYRFLQTDNYGRNNVNATIQQKLNNNPPYSEKALEDAGESWRSNRPTGFLTNIVSRVKQPYQSLINDMVYYTYSKYPLKDGSEDHKTTVFREQITKTIKAWGGFQDLIEQLINEMCVFGFCSVLWDDTRDWKPEIARGDWTYYQVETSQDVDKISVLARKKRYELSDLAPYVIEPEISATAGWNVKNLIKEMNTPTKVGQLWDAQSDQRKWTEWQRERSTYQISAITDYVEVGEVFVKETSGKISRYVFSDRTGAELCTQLDRFPSMKSCLAIFPFNSGSGSLMSSRGVGRELYNTHVTIDKIRNLVVDHTMLSGLFCLQKTDTAMEGVPPINVQHPIITVSKGYEVVQTGIQGNVDAFLKLDSFISTLAEIQFSTFIPQQDIAKQRSKRTAYEVSRVAQLEDQLKKSALHRFAVLFSKMIDRMQAGICHPEYIKQAHEIYQMLLVIRKQIPNAQWINSSVEKSFQECNIEMPQHLIPFQTEKYLDESAVECCLAMLENGLDAGDIILIAESKAFDPIPDNIGQDNQNVDLLVQRYSGNPNINQQELMRLDWSKKLGNDLTNRIVLDKQNLEANDIEQIRQQTLELDALKNGLEIHASLRDNHILHLDEMAKIIGPLIEQLTPQNLRQEQLESFDHSMKHFQEHLQYAQQAGIDGNVLGKYFNMAKMAMKHMHDIVKAIHGNFQQQQQQQTPENQSQPPVTSVAEKPSKQEAPKLPKKTSEEGEQYNEGDIGALINKEINF